MQTPLKGGLGGVGEYLAMSLLLNSGYNKFGDKGCWHISGGGWLRLKGVGIGINKNILDGCGVREEGCRAMAKR